MNLEDVIFIDNLPSIDLHGENKDSARVLIEEFIRDNIKLRNNKLIIIHGIGTKKKKNEVINDNKIMKNSIIVIIHGVGSGIIKKVTHDTLKKNKDVIDYRLFYNNTGVTIAKIKIDKK